MPSASFDGISLVTRSGLQCPSIEKLSQSKREQFRYEALALHSCDMRELKCSKRLALAITLIQTQWAQSLDDLTEMLCKLIADLETEGRLAYQEEILENQGRADQLVRISSQSCKPTTK